MTRAPQLALIALLLACSEPAPAATSVPPTSATLDGVRVRVGGREVVVHCMLACAPAETELTRLSNECVANPTSGPHRVSTGGLLLQIGCCQEATLAYDRACGPPGLPGCAQAWAARCEGTQAIERPIDDGDRGVSSGRGL